MTKKRKIRIGNLMIHGVFIIVGILYLVPFGVAVINSFKTQAESKDLSLALPKAWIFENYNMVIQEADLLKAALNGMIYALTTTAVVLLFCSMCSYVINRRKDAKTGFLFNYVMLGMVVPTAMIPTFLILTVLKLQGTYLGLILIYCAYNIPFTIFLYEGFIGSVPRELDEAAIMDGAGSVRTFFSIIFPLLKPITVTAGIFAFMNVWNDFSTQLYFGTSKIRSMPPSVYNFFGKYMQSWNLVFADVCLTALPVIIVYLFAQKYIIAGMTAGAVKG